MIRYWLRMNWFTVLCGLLVYGGLVWAQDPSAPQVVIPPLAAPPIPKTAVGVFDALVKASPALIATGVAVVMVLIKIGAPHLLAKIPSAYLPYVSGILSALATAATAAGADVALGGVGGVQPGMAALEGGPAATGLHLLFNQIAKAAEEKITEPVKEEKQHG